MIYNSDSYEFMRPENSNNYLDVYFFSLFHFLRYYIMYILYLYIYI